jgi:hypothetical protein
VELVDLLGVKVASHSEGEHWYAFYGQKTVYIALLERGAHRRRVRQSDDTLATNREVWSPEAIGNPKRFKPGRVYMCHAR